MTHNTDTAALWHTLAQDVEAYLKRRVEPGVVEDLRQEVFARVARHRGSVRDDLAVAAWVLRIAHNVVVDHLRRGNANGPGRQQDAAVDTLAELDDTDPADLAAVVLGPWLQATIATLPPAYAEAIELVELQGVSQKKAAKDLAISYTAMKSRVQRGRGLLRAALLRCCEIERDVRGRVIDWTPRCGAHDDTGPDCC